jgi:hypothetical protein
MPEVVTKDRRRSPRIKAERTITLVVDSERSQIANSVFAIDLSNVGARIRSGVDLHLGQLVTIIPDEGTGAAVPSRVVWIAPTGSGRAGEAGLAFLHPVAPGG